MMKIGSILLILLAFVNAVNVGPTIYEQDDFGDPIFPELIYSLSVDCDENIIKIIVMNESYRMMDGAITYLKYIQYERPLISKETTNKQGTALHTLPGEVELMRGLFVFVIEKDGYRTKEIHFDISRCYTNQTYKPPESPQEEPGIIEEINDSETEVIEEIENHSTVPVEIVEMNETVDETEEETSNICTPALIIPLLILFKRYSVEK